MGKLRNFIDLVKRVYAKSSSERYINYMRKNGVAVGDNVLFWSPRSTQIDLTRSCLIEIGNDVNINTHFTIMTHDFANFVFRNLYSDYVNNCGKVVLGNNIYIGTRVTILRGVGIGDNCIIGAGSVVTKSIPSNSVAAGVPCRVICTLEEYYAKRKEEAFAEAKEYVKMFRARFGRNPNVEELREEWIYFVDKRNLKFLWKGKSGEDMRNGWRNIMRLIALMKNLCLTFLDDPNQVKGGLYLGIDVVYL